MSSGYFPYGACAPMSPKATGIFKRDRVRQSNPERGSTYSTRNDTRNTPGIVTGAPLSPKATGICQKDRYCQYPTRNDHWNIPGFVTGNTSFETHPTQMRLRLWKPSSRSTLSSSGDSLGMLVELESDTNSSLDKSSPYDESYECDENVRCSDTTLIIGHQLQLSSLQRRRSRKTEFLQVLAHTENLQNALKKEKEENYQNQYEIELMSGEIDLLEDHCKHLSKQRDSYREIKEDISASLELKQNQLETLRSELSKRKIENWALKSVLRELFDEIRQLTLEQRDMDRVICKFRVICDQLKRENEDRKMQISRNSYFQTKSMNADQEKKTLRKQIHDLQGDLENLQQDRRRTETRLEQQRKQYRELKEENARIKEHYGTLETSHDDAIDRIKKLNQTLQTEEKLYRADKLSQDKKIFHLKYELEQVRSNNEELEKQRGHFAVRQENVNSELARVNEALQKQNSSMLHQIKSLNKEVAELKSSKDGVVASLQHTKMSKEKSDSEITRLKLEKKQLEGKIEIAEQRTKCAKEDNEAIRHNLQQCSARQNEEKIEMQRQIKHLQYEAEQYRLTHRTVSTPNTTTEIELKMKKSYEELESERRNRIDLEHTVQTLKDDKTKMMKECGQHKEEVHNLKRRIDEKNHVALDIETLRQEKNSAMQQVEMLKNENSKLKHQQKSDENNKAEVITLREEQKQLKKHLDIVTQREKRTKDDYEKISSDLQRLTKDKTDMQRNIEQLREEVEQSKRSQATDEKRINKTQKELESERKRRMDLEQTLTENEAKTSKDVEQYKEEIEEMKKRIDEKNKGFLQQQETNKTRSNPENLKLKQENSKLKDEIASLRSTEKVTTDTINKLTAEKKCLQQELDKKEVNANAIGKTLESVSNEKRIKEEEVERLRQEYKGVSSDLSKLKSEHEALQTAYRSLRVDLRDESKKCSDFEKRLDHMKKEKNELLHRLSQIASSKLTEGNPAIVDLSDESRPTKLAEIYSELYDNEWTEAFDEQVNVFHREEKGAIQTLLQMLLTVHSVCHRYSDGYLNNLRIAASGVPGKEESRLFEVTAGGDAPVELNKALRHIRAISTPMILRQIRQDLETTWNQTGAQIQEMTRIYIQKCLELCWEMSVKDPPVVLMPTPAVGSPVDTARFRFYTQSGSLVDYVVWPTLLLHQNGPTLAKGVLQGKKHRTSDKAH